MKIITFVSLALCTFACASTIAEDGIGDSIKTHIGAQKLNFHAGSDVTTEEDQILSQRLTELERSQGRSLVADALVDFLESFREVVINGNEVLPPLDPLQIEHIGPLELSSTGIRIQANVKNFEVQGLRWYVVDHVTFNALRLALGVRVTIPWIIFTGSYDASARIALISHTAGGNFRFFVNRLETTVNIRMGTNFLGGGTLILRELDISIVIHDVSVQITGMVGSSTLNSLINSLVQNAAQNLLVDQMASISEALSRELFDVVNDFLGNFTLDDLLGL